MKKIRLLIADDHGIVRKGIKALLATEKDMEVVGEAENGAEAVEKAASLSPDVVLMDLVMPEMDGIEATRRISAASPARRSSCSRASRRMTRCSPRSRPAPWDTC